MKTNSKYIADDGTEFDVLSDCAAYEHNLNWNQQPDRKKILEQIDRYLKQVEQHHKSQSFAYALKYHAKAEALIELLEGQDCGSYGGYDRDDPNCGKYYGDSMQTLKSRFQWLKDKYSR